MRIVNFNNHKTWTAWKKTYIDDLNIKITSLWNHLVYKNPPYIILNSVNLNDPVDLYNENYCMSVTLATDNDKQVDIFFPAHLQLHQGFYNNSNFGDALLGYWDGDYIYPISRNTFTPFKSNGSVQVESYDFPSGYCCISNILPSGENNPDNPKKHTINNYLLYPLGSSSFFTLYTNQNNFIANYRQNDMGDFINTILINLSSSLRYYYHIKDATYINEVGSWSSLNYAAQNIVQPYYIADIDNNIWTGGEDIVPEIYDNNNELIICDSKHQIFEQVEDKTLCCRLIVNTNISISNYARVELY